MFLAWAFPQKGKLYNAIAFPSSAGCFLCFLQYVQYQLALFESYFSLGFDSKVIVDGMKLTGFVCVTSWFCLPGDRRITTHLACVWEESRKTCVFRACRSLLCDSLSVSIGTRAVRADCVRIFVSATATPGMRGSEPEHKSR